MIHPAQNNDRLRRYYMMNRTITAADTTNGRMTGNGKTFVLHSHPYLGEAEAVAVAEVMQSGQIAQGEKVAAFESTFCSSIGVSYAAAVSSGTAALHLTLAALGVSEKDEVILPSYVCIALLNAVRYVGATPVLADIDPETANIDPKDAANRITKRTKAIIVPHLFGRPANMESLLKFDIPVIEDCAQAVGGTFQNRPLGTIGHAAVYSFYATKVMTTGEGGMVASSSKDLIDRIRELREYDNRSDGRLRYNYKMTDIQAAIGTIQLSRLSDFIRKRRSIAEDYTKAFAPLGLKIPMPDPGHIYFRYTIRLNDEEMVDRWLRILKSKGICCARPVYQPIHRALGLPGYEHSEAAWQQLLSLPIYPSLTFKSVGQVIQGVTETVAEADNE